MENPLDLSASVALPLAGERLESGHTGSSARADREEARVYLIDDRSSTLVSLFDLLTGSGFRAEASTSPASGLAQIARTRPSVVIASGDLRDMGGLEILDRIRQASPATRIILLSSCVDWDLHEEVLRRGGSHLISRCASHSMLLSLVEHLLAEES